MLLHSFHIFFCIKTDVFLTNIDQLLLNACETNIFSYMSPHFASKNRFFEEKGRGD